mmetsp:Transcript_7134/g.13185  ORF Transcript_7134/g.13185 Transcript_7134/m.13185 type:complete len:483 (+) Transcript_7134:347-1795(+)|eukprot:CAMPEP_0197516836 /NCGR_PEP_ID=MMETSP1318-20131121/1744_1 /TAXON_ID=552666 /ORGANISM="Partenskyella glossopodia, Strain RCC365" /LENGTH=482 /DNA_ID=CAMNT_0043065875 /DNA_START=329 /DNA_END=1777 /DNA_ORIENTATION=+
MASARNPGNVMNFNNSSTSSSPRDTPPLHPTTETKDMQLTKARELAKHLLNLLDSKENGKEGGNTTNNHSNSDNSHDSHSMQPLRFGRSESFRKEDSATIVIKVGTSSLVNSENGHPQLSKIGAIIEQICEIRRRGMNVVLVSSGAVGFGCLALGLKERPKGGIMMKQALAAVGQAKIMELYGRMFNSLGYSCAQVLLTYENLGKRYQYINARNTFQALFKLGVVPIVNENDTVAVEEIRFGDNDCLSAMVAAMINADKLIIMTDVEGLYTSNPNKNPDAKKIDVVKDVENLDVDATGAGSSMGTGGMATKITAAKLATYSGVNMWIVNAADPTNISKVIREESVGTFFKKRYLKLSTSKKKWIAQLPARQKLYLDDGAVKAVTKKKPLYAAGIKKVKGSFMANVAVGLCDLKGTVFAQGLVNYQSSELELIKGRQMHEVAKILGYHGAESVMHRGNIVLLQFAETKASDEATNTSSSTTPG